MEEITFSVGNHGVGATERLKTLLEMFEGQSGIHVQVDSIPYSSQRWSRSVEAALYHSGPDISEVGNSWVGDLVRMESLRPFSGDEVVEITQGAQYFETAWQSSAWFQNGVKKNFSIPWSADTRVIFYRRDLLEKAGIDEATAFIDFKQLEYTLSKLKANSSVVPLTLPTQRTSMTLHCLASWIWGEGGDFLDSRGTELIFDQAKALKGCKEFFKLAAYMSPERQMMADYEADEAFNRGEAAVIFSGFWLPGNDLVPEVRKNLGVVPMPGVPFVGGADLVIWGHSLYAESALKLIRFFHTEEAGKLLFPWFGLPICEEGWSAPLLDTALYQTFKAAIKKGRAFPTARLWGLVEKRITDVLSDIWLEVLKAPDTPPDEIVETQLIELKRRLQLTLEL